MSRKVVLLAALVGAVGVGAEDATWTRSEPFAFGVEYMAPGLARVYAATGATWAKPAPRGFEWDSIEPKPPVGGKHKYDWTLTDALIREYQEAGFRHFHIYTRARSSWASSKPLPLIGNPGFMPKPQYLNDYAEYLRSLVERYDGDGRDDMPGLRFPIRYWEVEAEFGTFWQSSVDDYLALLRLAHKTIKAADPNARVILQGFLWMGIFDGDPDASRLEEKMALPLLGPKIRQGIADTRRVLANHELFDVVEFHSLGDWTEIIGSARFLRSEMRKLGYQKPIWVGDLNFNINPMLWHGQAYYPYVPAQKEAIHQWLVAMRDRNNPRHPRAVPWFRAEQASFTAKKVLCAFGEGLAGVNVGNLDDWPIFSALPSISGTGGYCGLIDIQGLDRSAKSLPIIGPPRIPGQPRPAYWTLKLLITKLSPYMASTRLDLGPGVYAYRFHQPRPAARQPASVVALWYEDGKGQLPGDPEPKTRVALPTKATRAALTPIITAIGQETSTPRPLPVEDGRLSLTVTETPVLIDEFTAPAAGHGGPGAGSLVIASRRPRFTQLGGPNQ